MRIWKGALSCRDQVAALTADSFLDRMRDADVRPGSPAGAGQSVAGLSMLAGSEGSRSLSAVSSIPPGLAEHPDYELVGELGRGGMGVVYLARNKLLDRSEVLKVVSRELMDRRRILDRFQREIRNAAQLRHANIVTAYSAFRAGESVVFAMEYVDGHDLATYVKTQGPMPVAHACNAIYQAALGLQYAHEQGMVHRDIKPSNLILARQGRRAVVKVLDFGLAKATREGPVDKSLTHEGQMLGTPDFIAPEQSIDATKADIRADIYSLGCTLYYVLTGRPPFRGTSVYEVLQAHHTTEAMPVYLARPEVPQELGAVVAKMMAKGPSLRYQTPVEVAQALKPFFQQRTAAVAAPNAAESQSGETRESRQPGQVPITPAPDAIEISAKPAPSTPPLAGVTVPTLDDAEIRMPPALPSAIRDKPNHVAYTWRSLPESCCYSRSSAGLPGHTGLARKKHPAYRRIRRKTPLSRTLEAAWLTSGAMKPSETAVQISSPENRSRRRLPQSSSRTRPSCSSMFQSIPASKSTASRYRSAPEEPSLLRSRSGPESTQCSSRRAAP